ncbi:hypothetical protein BOX15_Mlig013074g1 [Macrostomum lignano]|uniref:Delta-like protein n=1 Tax=Macrostomum lignano TaxID=282301 RepID=A0A267ETU9_9PLAT|nr:hypothetical protein BOX15_Mlig013074g1 [Macrostomum lignano]
MKAGYKQQLQLQQPLQLLTARSKLVLLCLLVVVQSGKASRGLEFQLSLRGFSNPAGRLADGGCCSASGACPGACRTFVRVCVTVRHETGAIVGGGGGGFPGPNDSCAIVDNVTDLIGVNNMSKPLRELRIDPKAWTPDRAFTMVLDLLHLPQPHSLTNKTWGLLIARRVMREKNYLPTGNWTVHRRTLDGIGLEFGYRFRCRLGFYGNSCQKQCRSRNDMLGHYSCSATGEIQCLPGYSGARCTTPICQPACVHGTCTGPNQCSCFNGWRGSNCSDCIPMPQCSGRGYCTKPLECLCPPGYGGLFCDIDLRWCQHNENPCLNGGRCRNLDQRGYNYTCECPPGFTGFHCEREIHDCGQPWGACLNGGVCRQNGSSADADPSTPAGGGELVGGLRSCSCPLGFYGSRCQFNYTTCADRPCGDRGDCRNLPDGGGFSCSCHPGWAGRGCEENVNDCPKDYCANGGQCVDLVNRFQCICRLNYRGPRCTVNLRDCRNLTCLNGGVCRDLADGLDCDCPAGLSGKFCELGTPAASDWPPTVSWSSTEDLRRQPGVAVLLLVIAVLLILLLLLAAIVSVFVWQRRRKRRSHQAGATAAAAAAAAVAIQDAGSDDDDDGPRRQKIDSFGGEESAKLRISCDDFYSIGDVDQPGLAMNNSRCNVLRPGLAESKMDYFAHKQINNLLSASQGCLSPRELRKSAALMHGMRPGQSRPRLQPSSSMQFSGRLATVSRAGLSSSFVQSASVAMRHTRIPSCDFGHGWA